MGWHIDPEQFMRDEELLLERGVEVNDKHGTCITGGRRRDIVATKRRIAHDGETRGLIGYFVDVTDRNAIDRSSGDLSTKGAQTGLLNAKGLGENAVAYENIYRRRGTDFAYMELDIRGLDAIKSTYGREFEDRLIDKVADIARQAVGVRGICARMLEGSFGLMWQLTPGEDPRSIAERVHHSVTQITNVDGKRVRPLFASGIATFAETEDYGTLRALAQARMQDSQE